MQSKVFRFLPYLAALSSLVIYILTMSRGIMPIDAGELAASQYHLGISHPSGYPLFNILGFLWSKIPIGSVIFRLNLLNAIWVALANAMLIKTVLVLIEKRMIPVSGKNNTNKKNNTVSVVSVSPVLPIIAAITGVLLVAFTATWWIQSAGVEVYSLHIALLSLYTFSLVRIFQLPQPSKKDWIINGILLGLCFTNHLTSLLILPGAATLYFLKLKFKKTSIKPLILVSCFALLIFLFFYGFMMIRAGSSPVVNYGDPSNMEYLKRHVSGWQFQSFMGANEKKSNDTVAKFFTNFTNETGIVGILLLLGGMVYGFSKYRPVAIFLTLNILGTLIYASQYDIHDIENYFLLGYLSAAVFISLSLFWILTSIKSIQKNAMPAFGLLALPLLPIILNFKSADQSKLHYIDDYTKGALHSVAENAIILSWEWDVFVSPAYYYQLVENVRPDITIIDKELLRRSWYHQQIEIWDKPLADSIKAEFESFKEAVLPFERKQKFNPALIQPRFEAVIQRILGQYNTRPVYVSSLVLDADIAGSGDVKLPKGTVLIPDAYFFRVVKNDTNTYYPLSKPIEYNVVFTENKKENKFERQVLNYSMNVMSSRVGYEMGFGKKEEARNLVKLMQTIDPSITMPQGL